MRLQQSPQSCLENRLAALPGQNPKSLPMRLRLLAATIALILLADSRLTTHAGVRVALVIGMSGYHHAPSLKNPANDAKDLSAALRELGFEVVHIADANKISLDASIRSFSKRIADADVGLVFFAGHGVQVEGQNYLMPIDAKLERMRDLEFEAVRLELILGQMENGREGKISIVMLDACRDNPLARNLARRNAPSDLDSLRPTAAPAGRLRALAVHVGSRLRIRCSDSETA